MKKLLALLLAIVMILSLAACGSKDDDDDDDDKKEKSSETGDKKNNDDDDSKSSSKNNDDDDDKKTSSGKSDYDKAVKLLDDYLECYEDARDAALAGNEDDATAAIEAAAELEAEIDDLTTNGDFSDDEKAALEEKLMGMMTELGAILEDLAPYM